MSSPNANIADLFLAARLHEGRGGRVAIRTDLGQLRYDDVQALAHRYAHALASAGVEPEQRVLIALADGPEFVAALFGTLELGAVVVMANPALREDDVAHLLGYSRAKAVVTQPDTASVWRAAARRWLELMAT